jgi:DNA-binding transcriptional regulator GbsR (MarR family)
MSSTRLSPEQIRFIDDMAELLSAWSMSANVARLYGYLQIINDPVSLDDIARDLEISRSHAHTAAKILEDHGNAKGIATRGSKRILYVCGEDPGTPLRRQVAALGRMSELIAKRGQQVTEGEAGPRLALLGMFHKHLQNAMQLVIGSQQTSAADENDEADR